MASYRSAMFEFGEVVMGKDQVELHDKFGSAWYKGIWLGRSKINDTHLVGTEIGVAMVRTVKAMPKEEDSDLEQFRAMQWTPWRLNMKAAVYDGEGWTPIEGCPGCEYAKRAQPGRGRPPHHYHV